MSRNKRQRSAEAFGSSRLFSDCLLRPSPLVAVLSDFLRSAGLDLEGVPTTSPSAPAASSPEETPVIGAFPLGRRLLRRRPQLQLRPTATLSLFTSTGAGAPSASLAGAAKRSSDPGPLFGEARAFWDARLAGTALIDVGDAEEAFGRRARPGGVCAMTL